MELIFDTLPADRMALAHTTLTTAANLRPTKRGGWLIRLPDGRRTVCTTSWGDHDVYIGGSWLRLDMPEGGLIQLYRQLYQQ